MGLFSSMDMLGAGNNNPVRVVKDNIVLSRRSKAARLEFNSLKFVVAGDRINDFKHFIDFANLYMRSMVYRLFPGSEQPLIFWYLMNRCTLRLCERKYMCSCGLSTCFTMPKARRPNKRNMKDASLMTRPKCANDSNAIYLMFNRSCSPECRIMAHLRRTDYYNMDDEKDKIFQTPESQSYLIAYYVEMCRLSYFNCLTMYDSYDMIPDGIHYAGNKMDFYVNMFWKLYTFTVILAYRTLSGDPEEGDIDLATGGIGFNWFDFNPDPAETNAMNKVLYKYEKMIGQAFVTASRKARKHKVWTNVTKKESYEADMILYNGILEFLEEQKAREAKILKFGIENLPFNPFKELGGYFLARRSRSYAPGYSGKPRGTLLKELCNDANIKAKAENQKFWELAKGEQHLKTYVALQTIKISHGIRSRPKKFSSKNNIKSIREDLQTNPPPGV